MSARSSQRTVKCAEERCENCNEISASFAEYDAKTFRFNYLRRNEGSVKVCDRCITCYEARTKAANEICSSTAPKKLIVAGPGTGKSFMFSLLLHDIPKDRPSLVFTLINNLVDELKRDVAKLNNDQIKVNTLHGFCKEMLHKKIALEGINPHFIYLPSLPFLIKADAHSVGLEFSENDFQGDIANLNENSPSLEFYFHQAAYYNAVSHSDSVYRVFRFYRTNETDIPTYEIIIVDEYQDFNLLEASFVQLLATKSNIVIAGDDDQSLYGFRHASNKFIRELWKLGEFKKFRLPFCSRCTPVLVEAANTFIANIQKHGLLAGRIDREFKCYWPDKHAEHNNHPLLVVANCTKLKTVCQFVKRRILQLTKQEGLDGSEDDLQFIVIGPEAGYHLEAVEKCLTNELDMEVFEIEHSKKSPPLVIEEGYGILGTGRNSNLGWRIVLNCDPPKELTEIVKQAYKTGDRLENFLPPDYIEMHREAIAENASDDEKEGPVELPKRIRIKLTNFYGSKGLSALHTIVIGLNDHIFPKDPEALDDDEACKFIVALTRARRSCSLVSNGEFSKSKNVTINAPSQYLGFLPGKLKDSKRYGIKFGELVEI
jgi:superfamily I DNA/RNA helicase